MGARPQLSMPLRSVPLSVHELRHSTLDTQVGLNISAHTSFSHEQHFETRPWYGCSPTHTDSHAGTD